MPGTPVDAWPISEVIEMDEVAKQAIQDLARHEEQLVKLILFHDDRALRVLSLYVPIILALTAAAIATYQANKLTLLVGCMIGGTTASFLTGCFCAIAVLWTVPIYLPSRRPDFWNWALEHQVELRSTAAAYVKQSMEVVAHNEGKSLRASGYLTKAYICGVTAPLVGGAVVWVVYWSQS
jgi:hypothetical protein